MDSSTTNTEYIMPGLSFKDFNLRTWSRISKFRGVRDGDMSNSTKKIFQIFIDSTSYDPIKGRLHIDIGAAGSKVVESFDDLKMARYAGKLAREYKTANPDIYVTYYYRVKREKIDSKSGKKIRVGVTVDHELERVRTFVPMANNPELCRPKGGFIYGRAKQLFPSVEADYPPYLPVIALCKKFRK